MTDAPVRAFGTFTHDLHDLAAWLKLHSVTKVAMESTGVYWIPAYEFLEQHGFDVISLPRATPRMCRGVRPMSAMLAGCESFIPSAYCTADSGHLHRLQPCLRICGNANDRWNMPLLTSSICKRR